MQRLECVEVGQRGQWRCVRLGVEGLTEPLDCRLVLEKGSDAVANLRWVILIHVVGREMVHEHGADVVARLDCCLDEQHGLHGRRVSGGVVGRNAGE